MTETELRALIDAGRIERVTSDPDAALRKVREAEQHLASAELVAPSDPHGAYSLLYDAARKTIEAHMLSNGLRTKARHGAHDAVIRYAEAVLASESDTHIAHLDRMRRNRNRSEYGAWAISDVMVSADLAHARAIVELVARQVQA